MYFLPLETYKRAVYLNVLNGAMVTSVFAILQSSSALPCGCVCSCVISFANNTATDLWKHCTMMPLVVKNMTLPIIYYAQLFCKDCLSCNF